MTVQGGPATGVDFTDNCLYSEEGVDIWMMYTRVWDL